MSISYRRNSHVQATRLVLTLCSSVYREFTSIQRRYFVYCAGRKFSHSNPLQTWSAGPGPPDSLSPSRRESSCTCTSTVDVAVVPWIFKNALHAAIQTNAVDVLALLLEVGVDPNRTGTGSSTDMHSPKRHSWIILEIFGTSRRYLFGD